MDMVMPFFSFVLYNFPACMTILALVAGTFCVFFEKERTTSEIYLKKLMFFAVGLTGIWGFVVHGFYPVQTAKYMGWPNSPFQFQVAAACLGLGITGIVGWCASQSFRVATTIFTASLLWIDASTHLFQMTMVGGFVPRNVGSFFYNDLALPLLLIFFLYRNKCSGCKAS